MIKRTVLWNTRIRLTRITHSKSWFILQIWYAMCKSGPKVQWYFHLWLRQIAHVLRWEAVCITSSGREMSFWFYSTDSGMLGSMASLLEHTFSQPLRCRLLQKQNKKNPFFTKLVVTWVCWVKNHQSLIFKVKFPYWVFC